jgi:hypothetical protein
VFEIFRFLKKTHRFFWYCKTYNEICLSHASSCFKKHFFKHLCCKKLHLNKLKFLVGEKQPYYTRKFIYKSCDTKPLQNTSKNNSERERKMGYKKKLAHHQVFRLICTKINLLFKFLFFERKTLLKNCCLS